MSDSTAPVEPYQPLPVDDLIPREQLARLCRVSSSTISRWLHDHKLPPPDVAITRKAQQWRRSSLHAAGIKV